MSASQSYLDATLAFVVKDHLRHAFSDARTLSDLKDVRVAVARSDYFTRQLKKLLPQATVVRIASPREFFTDGNFDALLVSAEAGSAWTIRFPAYTVAVPQPGSIALPLVYVVPYGDVQATQLVSRWITLKRKSHEYKTLYQHWILGKSAALRAPRWSVIRDVLKWVE